MEREHAIEHQIKQETCCGPREDGGRSVILHADGDGFGEQVEERDADDRPGTETEYQMQLVAQLERQ